MARHSVALSAALMHTLIGIVCAMPAGPGAPSRGPGMAGRTISCPGCGLGFKTHRAVRQHQGHMAKTSKCFKDLRPPIPSAWSSGGARGRTGGGPQSWRPVAWYDVLGHRLRRRTQSAPDGLRRPACTGGLASRLGLRPAGGRPRAGRPPG